MIFEGLAFATAGQADLPEESFHSLLFPVEAVWHVHATVRILFAGALILRRSIPQDPQGWFERPSIRAIVRRA